MFVDKLSNSDRNELVEKLMTIYKSAKPVIKKFDYSSSIIKLENLLNRLHYNEKKLLKNVIKSRVSINYFIESKNGKVSNYNISIYDFTSRGHTDNSNLDNKATQFLRFFLSNKFGEEYKIALSLFDNIVANNKDELLK